MSKWSSRCLNLSRHRAFASSNSGHPTGRFLKKRFRASRCFGSNHMSFRNASSECRTSSNKWKLSTDAAHWGRSSRKVSRRAVQAFLLELNAVYEEVLECHIFFFLLHSIQTIHVPCPDAPKIRGMLGQGFLK